MDGWLDDTKIEAWIVGWTNSNISPPEIGLLPQKQFSFEPTVDFQNAFLVSFKEG